MAFVIVCMIVFSFRNLGSYSRTWNLLPTLPIDCKCPDITSCTPSNHPVDSTHRSTCISPRAAILFLMHPERLHVILEALNSLENNFFSIFGYRYPIFVFVEKELDEADRHLLQSATNGTVRVIYLPKFSELPENLTADYDREGRNAAGTWPIGYHHMIRFLK